MQGAEILPHVLAGIGQSNDSPRRRCHLGDHAAIRGLGKLGRGFWRWEQHEVVAVVEPGLVQDVLHVSCGRCRGDVEGPGYLAVGNDALADQVKGLPLPGSEAGLPGVAIRRQPIREHFDLRVAAP